MNILIIGSGGREHAIIENIAQSKLITNLFAINGNAGIAKLCQTFSNIDVNDHKAILEFCIKYKIEFVIIGPEQPLVNGLSDFLRENNIDCFGPSKAAAILEGSKIFMKDICKEYNIPTANYQHFTNKDEAISSLSSFDPPYVIKADGIAAGKGVIIVKDEKEASKAIEEIFSGKFGDAGNAIIIEEFLAGKEVSVFFLCDGDNAFYFSDACDYKKIGEGDVGLNTGGMGSYSPSFLISEKLKSQINSDIVNPTLKAMRDRDMPFSGFLFAGLILTKNGPKLLEFNVRFGDPESQVIFPRLEDDLLDLMIKSNKKNLDSNYKVNFSANSAVCVVMAAKGYPQNYKKGSQINNLENICDNKGVKIFHAGTKSDQSGNIISNGGRVINVVGFDKNFDKARINAYNIVTKIDWDDAYFRKDIADVKLKKGHWRQVFMVKGVVMGFLFEFIIGFLLVVFILDFFMSK